MYEITHRDALELLTEVYELFDDPDIQLSTEKRGIDDNKVNVLIIETEGIYRRMEVRIDGMVYEVKRGHMEMKQVARAIVKIYDAIYPFQKLTGSVIYIN